MKYIKTQTEDGLHYTGLITESIGSKKIIINIHGMSGDIYTNSYYPVMHEYYPANGWSFLATENRGTHSITQFLKNDDIVNIGNAYEIFEDCVADISAWVKTAESLGYEEIWLQSHSLGPSKVVYYMNNIEENKVNGLIFISPSDMVGLTQDPIGIVDHEICIAEAYKLVDLELGKNILSHKLWGNVIMSANTYINFFGRNANTAIFNYYDNSLGFSLVNKLQVPVLAITGTNDDGIVSVMNAYDAMLLLERELVGSPRKKTIVYDGAEHDFCGFERCIVQDVLDFIS